MRVLSDNFPYVYGFWCLSLGRFGSTNLNNFLVDLLRMNHTTNERKKCVNVYVAGAVW